MSHFCFGNSFNKVYALIVFTKRSLPEIGDSKNALAATHSAPNARRIIQISLYYIGPLPLEKSRGFGVRTARHAPYLDRASFQ
jgi:hypothetical protein